jgi:hypothetical protein
MILKKFSNSWKSSLGVNGVAQVSFWSLGIFLFTLIQDLINWPILQFARVVSPIKYRDSVSVLEDADCFRTLGSGVYGLEIDTGCPGYIYGTPLLRVLNLLQFGQEDTYLFVYLMRGLFAVSIALIIRHLRMKQKTQLLLTSLLMFSPGVQLMLYNSNFDLIIFAMIVFGYLAIQNKKVTLGLILIFLSGVFKFYTIPLLLLYIFLLPQIKSKITSAFLFLVAALSAFLDLRLMQEPIPSNGYAQFGFTIFSKYLEQIGKPLSDISSYLLSGGIFIGTLVALLILNKKYSIFDKPGAITSSHFYMVVSTIFISCYMTGLSYDPRLLYLSLAGYMIIRTIDKSLVRTALTVLLLVASLFSCGIELGLIPEGHAGFHPFRIIQLVNDCAIGIFAVILFLTLSQWFTRLLRKPR